jgi:hypothetical protein
MAGLTRIVAALQRLAADPKTRSAVLAVVRRDGTLDVRIASSSTAESADGVLCVLRAGIREAEAAAAALLLPVRTLWGDDCACDFLDAEAFALVAVEELHDAVVATALRCAMHALPDGWEEAQDRLRWLSEPLREAVAR